MTSETRTVVSAIRLAVEVTEEICRLPAVPTQDWCNRAASILCGIKAPSAAVVMIGQIDEGGQVIHQEATGSAGCDLADVATTIGEVRSAERRVSTDPRSPQLMRLRSSLAQAGSLGWAPGVLPGGACKVLAPERPAVGGYASSIWKRWQPLNASAVVLAAAGLGSNRNRLLVAEMGLTRADASFTSEDLHVLEGVLPALARRAMQAVGTDDPASFQWLTQKEWGVLRHLLQGMSVKMIAERLGRSQHTVHDHVKSLHRKLNAQSRGALVARALGHLSVEHGSGEDDEGEGEGGGGPPESRSPSSPGAIEPKPNLPAGSASRKE